MNPARITNSFEQIMLLCDKNRYVRIFRYLVQLNDRNNRHFPEPYDNNTNNHVTGILLHDHKRHRTMPYFLCHSRSIF